MIAKEKKQLENVEKDVSKELSFSSSDPNIRKLARRQRIQRRLSVLHKYAFIYFLLLNELQKKASYD